MGNMILFPSCPPTYSWDSEGVCDHLVWINEAWADALLPADRQAPNFARYAGSLSGRRFPALWFSVPSRETLLYFHGNSADLGDIFEEMQLISQYADCSVLAFEFPGYGVCASLTVDPKLIDRWAMAAFVWLLHMGAEPRSIIPFGRSIGTGPAALLAATVKKDKKLQVGGLILHSPYLSIHKIVSDYSIFGTWIITNHWETEVSIKVLCPTTPLLVVHGMNDEVIPISHGKTLYETYECDESMKEGHFPVNSPHNAYLIIDDLGIPIKHFLSEKALSRYCGKRKLVCSDGDRKLPDEYKREPKAETAGGVNIRAARTVTLPAQRAGSQLLERSVRQGFATRSGTTLSDENSIAIASIKEFSDIPEHETARSAENDSLRMTSLKNYTFPRRHVSIEHRPSREPRHTPPH